MTSVLTLKVADAVEAYDSILKRWSVATIIAQNKTQIHIHWYGWKDRYNEWINKDNKHRLSSLNTYTVPVTMLKPLSLSLSIQLDPVFYSSKLDNKTFIIKVSNKGIHKYDIINDEWININKSIPDPAYKVIDNSTLYLLNNSCITTDHFLVDTINLDAGSWNAEQFKLEIPITNKRYHTEKVQLIDDKLHLFQSGIDGNISRHLVYDFNTKEAKPIIIQETNKSLLIYIYVNSMHKFLSFGDKDGNNTIFEGEINLNGSIEWSEKIKLDDFERELYDLVNITNIFDTLLLITFFGLGWEERVILDLFSWKLFKINTLFPIFHNGEIINTLDNDIHIVHTPYNIYGVSQSYHYKINLLDIIPLELHNLYRKNKYHKLIFGYTSEMEKNNEMSYNLPIYLKELILKYYPCFLYY